MRIMAQGTGTSRLVLGITLFVLIGTPLVGFIWEALNTLLAGHLRPMQLLIAVPAAVLLYLLLRFMARAVQRWDAERGAPTQPGTR